MFDTAEVLINSVLDELKQYCEENVHPDQATRVRQRRDVGHGKPHDLAGYGPTGEWRRRFVGKQLGFVQPLLARR